MTQPTVSYSGTGIIRQTQQGSGILGVGWRPRIIDSVWGYYQIIVGGVDVTYYRDVITKPSRLTWAEPFGAATAELNFPQISPFEWKPGWMFWGAHVDVWHVDENFNRVGEFPMWEGLLVATAASSDDSTYGLTASCIGALFQLDFYKKKPDIGRGWKNTDIGISIQDDICVLPASADVGLLLVEVELEQSADARSREAIGAVIAAGGSGHEEALPTWGTLRPC